MQSINQSIKSPHKATHGARRSHIPAPPHGGQTLHHEVMCGTIAVCCVMGSACSRTSCKLWLLWCLLCDVFDTRHAGALCALALAGVARRERVCARARVPPAMCYVLCSGATAEHLYIHIHVRHVRACHTLYTIYIPPPPLAYLTPNHPPIIKINQKPQETLNQSINPKSSKRATHEHKRSHIPAPPHEQQTPVSRSNAGLGG